MKRACGFYITLFIIGTFAGCNSNTKNSEDTSNVRPIVETAAVYSASPASTPFIRSTPNTATNESASPTINSSTVPSPIASKSSSKGNIEQIIFNLIHSNKETVLKSLGKDYEIVNAGGDDYIEGYRYKDLGLTFAFEEFDDKAVRWIDCDDGIEIRGASGGMNFAQIQNKLGEAPVYDTFISSPEYKAYQMHYKIDNCIVRFFSQNDDGKESKRLYLKNTGKM